MIILQNSRTGNLTRNISNKNGVEDREVLQQIMKDAQNREFDILLAYMSDRIGRKEEYIIYISELNRLGVEVWTV